MGLSKELETMKGQSILKKPAKINEKIQQGEDTKKEILKIAKKLFGKKGYLQTSIEDILTELGLTKGALYHHFQNKREIFYEVCRTLNEEAGLELEGVSWKEFKALIGTIWKRAEEQEFVQIWVRDAYSVLTTDEIFLLDETYITSNLQKFLERMTNEKRIFPLPSFEEAHLLMGLINQGLWLISNTPKKDRVKLKTNLTKVILSWVQSRETKLN
jgi:AcrR family transcriptional regulator